MIKLEIKEINGFNYILEGNDRTYSLNLEFFDIEETPEVKDYMYLNEKLLNKNYIEYDTFYRFGSLGSEYGRENLKDDSPEIIILVINDKRIYLKRIYG